MLACILWRRSIKNCESEWRHWKIGFSPSKPARAYSTVRAPVSLSPSDVSPPIRTSTI